jgi:hypothetical protein
MVELFGGYDDYTTGKIIENYKTAAVSLGGVPECCKFS